MQCFLPNAKVPAAQRLKKSYCFFFFRKRRILFFSEEKNQKTFVSAARRVRAI
jgi:hypothetical protein